MIQNFIKKFCIKHRSFLLKLLLDILFYILKYLTRNE